MVGKISYKMYIIYQMCSTHSRKLTIHTPIIQRTEITQATLSKHKAIELEINNDLLKAHPLCTFFFSLVLRIEPGVMHKQTPHQ